MSVLFSKSCEYALQAVLFLARRSNSGPVLLREISDGLAIPHHFLNKVLQHLSKDGIVESHKGTNGGFTLGRDPRRITLGDVIKAIDGDSFLQDCVLGFPDCGDHNPCPVHSDWKQAKAIVLDNINRKDVETLSKELDGKLHLLDHLKKA